MKALLFLSIAALVHQTTCSREPVLEADPNSAADCVEWFNNGPENESCKGIRAYFGVTPEDFHKWNPSVSLDCEPWEFKSYCIVTQEKLDDTAATATTSSSSKIAKIITSTTTSSTPDPSPTVWNAKGCYSQEDSKTPIVEKKLSPAGGDAALTVPGCKNTCYLKDYGIAAVRDGNQCWCSNYVEGWTRDETECNIPCTGDKETFCGGKGVYNVFMAEENEEPFSVTTSPPSVTTSSATTSSVDSAVETVLSATQSSGASRNRVMF